MAVNQGIRQYLIKRNQFCPRQLNDGMHWISKKKTPMKANFGKLIDIPILYQPAHLLMMKGGKIERNVDC